MLCKSNKLLTTFFITNHLKNSLYISYKLIKLIKQYKYGNRDKVKNKNYRRNKIKKKSLLHPGKHTCENVVINSYVKSIPTKG
jgi:hypothetical protein